MSDPHDLSERETACADGMCPLCLAEEAAALKAQFARFHHPECPHRHDILIGNCCENNDAALMGMQHWQEATELRELLKSIDIQLARGHYTQARADIDAALRLKG